MKNLFFMPPVSPLRKVHFYSAVVQAMANPPWRPSWPERGLKLIEDDRCLLEWDENQNSFMIRNQMPIASLWPNIAALEKNKKAKRIGPVRKNIPKIQYNISQIVPSTSIAVKKLFLINMDNGENRIEKK